MELSLEKRMPEKKREGESAPLPLLDNRAQIALARFAFAREHPEVVAPSDNDIMSAWVAGHAAEYRKLAEADPDATLDVNDESALAECFERVLAARDAGPTIH